jgi:hypothetical protein
VSRAWALAGAARQDADPAVRVEAVSVVALFDYEHAQAALSTMEKDSEASVAAAAHQTRIALKSFHDLSPDLKY